MFGIVKSLVKGLEKPAYEVVEKCEKYEVRKYFASKWAITTVKGIAYKESTSTAFRRLFKYIQGENEEKATIDMTAPVTTRVDPGEGPNCESTFTMGFFVPAAHEAKPPNPTSPEVSIEERPEMTVYVTTFGGFADQEKWIEHARLLTEAVGDTTKYHSDYYYTVGYDAPFKLVGRTNEVWFVKKE